MLEREKTAGERRVVWLKRSPPNVGLADSIKKISKGPLWGAVKKKGCFESATRLKG